MRKEIKFKDGNDHDNYALMYVIYGEGVRLAKIDVLNVFDRYAGFTTELNKSMLRCSPIYVDDEGDQIECITVPCLVEAAVNTEGLDRNALYNMMYVIEESIVNVWG